MLPAWVVPAPSLLNDPPAAMKALCNFKMHSLALHLAVLVRQKFSVGSSGDDRFESNMHSGQDDEDLQKALAFGWSLYVWVEEFNRFAQSLGSFIGTHGGLT